MINLSKFNPSNKLQEAVIIFIVGQLSTKEDISEVKKVFQNIDLNNDGNITMKELVATWEVAFDEENSNAVEEV